MHCDLCKDHIEDENASEHFFYWESILYTLCNICLAAARKYRETFRSSKDAKKNL